MDPLWILLIGVAIVAGGILWLGRVDDRRETLAVGLGRGSVRRCSSGPSGGTAPYPQT